MRRLSLIIILFCASASASQRTTFDKVLSYQDKLTNELPVNSTMRLAQVADAIDAATDVPWERDWLIAVARHESDFRKEVQDCTRRGDNGNAWGLWQSWVFDTCPSVEVAAKEAIRHLRVSANYCKAKTPRLRVLRGTSLYGTGKTCMAEFARSRLRTWEKLRAR